MCGIAGFCLANDRLDARVLACNLLMEIEARGKDATGAAWYDPADGQVWYLKAPVRARDFTVDLLDAMPANASTVILHTRYATQGSPQVEENNHPIVRPDIVGVHNGHISNDAELFRALNVERYGQVDSEAAFALLEEAEGESDAVIGLLPKLRGGAALAWMETGAGNRLNLARVKSSPLAVGQSKTGHFVFASTMAMLQRAAGKSGLALPWKEDIGEGTFMQVRGGVVHEWLTFTPPMDAYRLPSYSSPSAFATAKPVVKEVVAESSRPALSIVPEDDEVDGLALDELLAVDDDLTDEEWEQWLVAMEGDK